MGFIKKLLGRDDGAQASVLATAQFQDSEATPGRTSRNEPRRELLRVVLRDTMRKHGIPSDWIECSILSAKSRTAQAGLHLHLVVRKGDEELLTYVHAFQNSFRLELSMFDANASDWLLSLSWRFEGEVNSQPALPTDAAGWSSSAVTPTSQELSDDVEQDLQALFAIRDAALNGGDYGHVDFQATEPAERAPPTFRRPG